MHKKLMLACMAIAAFAAFVVAPAASAQEIGETDGSTPPVFTPLKPGALITGTQLGKSKMTDKNGNVLVECEVGLMTGELTENGPGDISGDISSASFTNAGGANCSSSFGSIKVTTAVAGGLPWCLTTTKGTDNFTVRGGNCPEAARSITFILDSSLAGECKYAANSVGGTFVTDVSGQDAVLTVNKGGPFAGDAKNSFLCPAEGFLDMEFTLETEGTPVVPLYIK